MSASSGRLPAQVTSAVASSDVQCPEAITERLGIPPPPPPVVGAKITNGTDSVLLVVPIVSFARKSTLYVPEAAVFVKLAVNVFEETFVRVRSQDAPPARVTLAKTLDTLCCVHETFAII